MAVTTPKHDRIVVVRGVGHGVILAKLLSFKES